MHRAPACFHRIWYVANNAYRRITSTKAPTPSIYSSAPSYAEMKAIIEGSGLLVVMARVVGDDENGRDAGNTEDKAGRPVAVTQA
jgi:hypothetical protein